VRAMRAKALDRGTWLSDALLLLVGRFGAEGRELEVSTTVGDRDVPLEARSRSYRHPGEGRRRGVGRLVIVGVPEGEGVDRSSLALRIHSGRTTLSLRPAELSAALTDLRTLLRNDLMGLDARTRTQLLELILSSARDLTGGSYSLSRKLLLVREALREQLPHGVIKKEVPQGLRIDLILAVDERSYWFKGWVRDKEAKSARLVAVSPEGARTDLLQGAFRYARPEMDEYYGDPGEEKGFIKYGELPVPSRLSQGWIAELRDAGGGGIEADAPEVISDIVTVRNTILEDLESEYAHSEQLTLNHGYPALTRVQELLRGAVEVKSVAQYGAPAESPEVSIVVPLYKRIDYLEHQLAQFAHDPEIGRADLIYVLDSPELAAAVADLATALHRLYGVSFRVVTLKSNVGFSNANNVGASFARGRLLLLLNSDVLPDRPGWVDTMAAFYDATPNIGALGAKLLYEDDTLQHAGMYFAPDETSLWGNLHYFKGLHRSLPPANVARPVPAVTGACLMIDREMYEELGGLRDIYVLGGYEDSDLCLQLSERGRENWYLPEVELYHLEAQSFAQPAPIRKLATRYNLWLHTHLWGERIEEIMQAFQKEQTSRPSELADRSTASAPAVSRRADARGARPSATGVAHRGERPFDSARKPRARAQGAWARTRYIDVERTCLQKLFFSKFDSCLGEELLATVDEVEFDLPTLAQTRDSRVYVYSGWVYWFLFLKGYLEYRRSAEVGPGNTYFDYLRNHYTRDPGIAGTLDDPRAAADQAARRFQDMDLFRDRSQDADLPHDVEPVRAVVTGRPSETSLPVFETENEESLAASRVDGWHRLFAAKVFGAPRLRCEFVQEDEDLSPLRGAIDDLSLDGKRLRIRGWCLDPGGEISGVEVRAGDRLVGVAGMVKRPDIGEVFERVRHAGNSGFALDCEHDLQLDGLARFDLTALRELLPVGRMSACYLPGMFDEREWPPGPLTERVLNVSDPRKLALTSLKTLHDMLEPVSRHRALETFKSVLDWGCGCGALETFMPRLLPAAEITGIDTDGEAIEWCRRSGPPGTYLSVPTLPPTDLPAGSFDLVLGYSSLTRLGREGQSAWIAEISRLLASGGYAAVTVYGELVRPFITDQSVLDELDAEGISEGAGDDAGGNAEAANGSRPT
jgi:GT2 family glycosyltransferase